MTATGFKEHEWLEAPIFKSRLIVTCLGGMNIPRRLPFCTELVDNDCCLISYLQMCLHQRGLISTEMAVLRLLEMFSRDPSGRVQLLFQDAWSHYVAFVEQNKNKLLDIIEDTIYTAIALARASFPSFQIELDDARRDFPYHKPLDILQICSILLSTKCSCRN